MTEGFIDKRMFERVSCSLEGEYLSSNGQAGKTMCFDISALGVRLNMSDPLPVGDKMKMKFATKKQVPFFMEGIVRWCRQGVDNWYAGISFNKPLLFPVNMVV